MPGGMIRANTTGGLMGKAHTPGSVGGISESLKADLDKLKTEILNLSLELNSSIKLTDFTNLTNNISTNNIKINELVTTANSTTFFQE
jgi:hypothetical protein